MPKGRPREFNREAALERALLAFWTNGYNGTSLDDLTQAMEIGRPSLYAAFGDKEKLFVESIDYYRGRFIRPIFKKLVEAPSLREGVPAFLKGLGRLVCGKDTPAGCFVACVLTEEACASPLVRAKLETIIGEGDEAFARIFQQHERELRPGLPPARAGKLLTTFVHGLSIRARAGATERDLAPIAESFVELLLGSGS